MYSLSTLNPFKSAMAFFWVGLFCLALQCVALPLPALAESAFKPFGPSNNNQSLSQPAYSLPNTGVGGFQQNSAYYNNANPYGQQQTIIINRSCDQRGHAFNAQGLSVPQRVGPSPALPTWGVGTTSTGRSVPNRTVGGPPQLR